MIQDFVKSFLQGTRNILLMCTESQQDILQGAWVGHNWSNICIDLFHDSGHFEQFDIPIN